MQSLGFAGYLNQQYNAPVGTTGFAWLDSRGYNQVNNFQFYNAQFPADYMIWNQLFTSTDAVRKRVALALSEIFVVSTTGIGNVDWRGHVMAAYWDMLAANAFGNFRQLLQDVTLNPAMGLYLNTRGNQRENTATGRVPDENYAREVMQLFTIGLYQLNTDGTERRDAQGNRIDSYTESDVSNLARVFTGYNFDNTGNVSTPETNGTRQIPSTLFTRLPMTLTASLHSPLAATFLGTTIPANTPGGPALATALDTLFNHPNTGPFFAKQLIQRLVTSNPSPAYVGRVAATFANNGSGVRGDMRAVVSAVLLDTEARGTAGLASTSFGKLREPMLRLVQWGRTFGITSARGSWKLGDLSNPSTQLAQSPLRAPSVFNFFRPGYVPPSTALATAGAVAPELQIVNESSTAGYLNYMQGAIGSGIFVNAPDVPQNASNASNGFDINVTYAAELPLALDAAALVNRLALLLTANQLNATNRTLMVNALNATPLTSTSTDAQRRQRVQAAVLMVMASADYLVQK